MEWLWAAEAGSNVDPVGLLTQYGPLGIFAVLLIIRDRTSSKREQDRGDRLEAANERLNTFIQEKAIPALLTSAAANRESQELLSELYTALRDALGPRPPRRANKRPITPEDEEGADGFQP